MEATQRCTCSPSPLCCSLADSGGRNRTTRTSQARSTVIHHHASQTSSLVPRGRQRPCPMLACCGAVLVGRSVSVVYRGLLRVGGSRLEYVHGAQCVNRCEARGVLTGLRGFCRLILLGSVAGSAAPCEAALPPCQASPAGPGAVGGAPAATKSRPATLSCETELFMLRLST